MKKETVATPVGETEEKVNMEELIEKGKKGALSSHDLDAALETMNFDIDSLDKLYETLEDNGIALPGEISSAEMSEIEHGYAFQTRAIEDLRAFLDAARAEGYTVSISLTYRSYIDQRVRFNGMASTIYDRGGCTLAEAEQQAMEMGYYPGTDEHQTGLAVNFVAEGGEAKFSTPVLKWMREHCHEYGFILRYPEGKEDKTGRDAEAGHFRYVGQLAAEYIMRKGITLEEFRQAYKDQEEIEDGGWLW